MNVQRIMHRMRQGATSCQTLKNPVLKILNSIDSRGDGMRRSVRWTVDMDTDDILRNFSLNSSRAGFSLSTEDTLRYLRIVLQSQAIRRHLDLLVWLRGELQHFVPHDIFVSAWGDFSSWNLKLDVISAMPGVRTEQLREHSIDDFIRLAHTLWVEGGRQPLVIKARDALKSIAHDGSPMYAALSEMQSILVHGIRDERGGHESLYVALHSGSFTKGRCKDRFFYLVDWLVPHIDIALRRMAAYPLVEMTRVAERGSLAITVGRAELSKREQEILGWICQGKTNVEIAATLRISPFTVKNHVQRIFKKIGVTNRMQAATKYSETLNQLRNYLELNQDFS